MILDSVLVHILALVVGSTFASVIYEGVAGNERFSLPFVNIMVVTVVGTVLSLWWGWVATLSTLGLYTAFCVAGGLLDRFPDQVDGALGARALETREITDIVFRTELSLREIAEVLGIEDPEVDGENYWEWVIGSMGSHPEIDITRTHTKSAGEVDTRIFVVGGGLFADDLEKAIVERLRPIVSGTIKCGQSIYLRANDYDFVTLEEY